MSEQQGTGLSQARFFVTAQRGGYYEGSFQLPDGTGYKGRFFPNKGAEGRRDWYRAELIGTDAATFNTDARFAHDEAAVKAALDAAGIDPKHPLKPLEIRLNPNGKEGATSTHIGSFLCSRGVFVVFAKEITFQGRPALAGNIKAQVVAAERPSAQAMSDAAQAPLAASKRRLRREGLIFRPIAFGSLRARA